MIKFHFKLLKCEVFFNSIYFGGGGEMICNELKFNLLLVILFFLIYFIYLFIYLCEFAMLFYYNTRITVDFPLNV